MMRAIVLLLLAAPALADLAVRIDGSVLERPSLEIRGEQLVAGKKEYPLRAFYLVEKENGELLWAPDLIGRLRGYEFLARDRLRAEAVRLCKLAIAGRSASVARRMLEVAQRNGYFGRPAESLAGRLERLEKKTNVSVGVRGRRAAEEAKRLPWIHSEVLVARARAAGNDLVLLREALRRSPALPSAGELLAEMAPKTFALGDARLWLDWHLDIESKGVTFLDAEVLDLKRARRFWRPDLFGLVAGPIQLVTPVKDTQVVGRCLAYGRLTCDALSKLFADYPTKRNVRSRMTVFLFPSRKEYLEKTGTHRSYENPADLQWTAGHYSPSEGVSRFYWHKDLDAERRIVGTCVHELTHHWLAQRNPAYVLASVRGHLPGYWIVEGFATFMEEGRYDIERGSWQHFDPRARSLDIVQSLIGKRAFVRWDQLLTMNQRGFRTLPTDGGPEYTRRWSLLKGKMSPRRMFYEQGAAVCHFLYHAEGGRYRKRLLDFVANYYAGRTKLLEPHKAFGMGAAELGRKVENFSVSVANGWRPK